MKATLKPRPLDWSWHYDALTRLQETLLRESMERNAASRAASDRGGSDIVDVANDECEHDRLLAQMAQEQTELAEVDAALERLRKGTYGICELTGESISAQRLRAIPWTRWSQKVAVLREASGRARSGLPKNP